MKRTGGAALALLAIAAAVLHGCSAPQAGGAPGGGDLGAGVPPATTPAETPELPERPTLGDYIAYAERTNPGLRAEHQRWQATLEMVRQAKSLPDPKLGYANYVETVETRVGPQRWSLSASQTFPWFGTLRLRGRMASQAANAARQEYESQRLKLRYRVSQTYCDYYYLARAVAVTEENVALLERLEQVALAQYRAGQAPNSAVIRVQIERAKLQDRLTELTERRRPVVARLNAALGRRSDAPLPWPTELPESSAPLDDETLVKRLRRNNPQLRAIDAAAAKATAALALARKQRFPDLTFGVTYIATGEASAAGVADSGKDPVIASVSINLPLWAGKYRAAEREARARLEALLDEKRNTENTLVADLRMALYSFHDAERKIKLYEEMLIPQARQSLNVTEQAFKAGKADFLTLIDAQRTLLELQLLRERPLAVRLERLAEIEMLVGQQLQPAPAELGGNPDEPEAVED